MNASRPGDPRDVGAIVDDDLRLVRNRKCDEPIRDLEQWPGCEVLGPYLNEWCAAIEESPSEIECRPSGALGYVDIQYRVEGRVQAVSARLDFFCFGMKRSMNPVLRRPAWKSGSAMIF